MEFPSQTLLNYWQALPKRKGVPAKSDLDPSAIRSILPHIFIVETIADRPDYRFRLFGTHLVELVGSDKTGETFSTALGPDYAEALHQLYRPVIEEKCCVLTRERLMDPGRDHIEVEIMRVPFADPEGSVRFIVGAFTGLGVGNMDRKHTPGVKIFTTGRRELHTERTVGASPKGGTSPG